MNRENIFDVLCQTVDISYEISKLNTLCKKDMVLGDARGAYKLEDFIDEYCLIEWKNRNRCISCAEIRQRLNISDFDIKNKLKERQVFYYLEYLANLIWLCDTFVDGNSNYGITKDYIFLCKNLEDIVDSMNCELRIIEEEEKVLLVEKNAAVTAAVEIVEPELAYDIIRYNHHSFKGNIGEKRRILKMLADKIEPMRARFKKLQKHKDLESDVGFLLNKMNIRHNNVEGEKTITYVRNLSDEEIEMWYDETYQLILLCILEYDNLDRNKRIAELKEKINENDYRRNSVLPQRGRGV